MRTSTSFGLIVVVVLGGSAAASGRELTFEERVKAQEAIERVYYAHQIGTTRPFESAVSKSALEHKVSTHLKRAAALQAIWMTPTTDDMLEREFRRMSEQTRLPERLQELLRALGDDPLIIRECLVRPTLVDRLSRSAFDSDDTIHAALREEAEDLRRDLLRLGVDALAGDPRRTVVEIVQAASADVSQPASEGGERRAIGLGPESFARWRGRAPGRPGEIGPVRSERDAFVISVVLEERSAWARIAFFAVPKRTWDDWWDGVQTSLDPREIGIATSRETSPSFRQVELRERSVSSESTPFPVDSDDAWDDGSLDALPHARSSSAKVWTGSLVFVWGGYNGAVLRTGGRYDPATDSWSATAIANAPSPSEHPTASWTGSAVAVRSGDGAASASTASRYDPMTDTWSSRPASPNPEQKPDGRVDLAVEESNPEFQTGGASPDSAPREGVLSASPQPGLADSNPQILEFPPVSTVASGLSFPTTHPVSARISLEAQGVNFGHCLGGPFAKSPCVSDASCLGGRCELVFDNILCLSYNMSCGSVRANTQEYGFSDALEATYDSNPAPGRQTWVERNWNYTSAVGVGWRPFHFALEVDANSTCVGGTNDGGYCTLLDEVGVCTGGGTCTGTPPTGGARWTFTPNNRNGNSSLQLRWPWVAANARIGTDPYWLHGFSSWMRTSDFNPGTTTAGGRFTTYLDHHNDRRGPNFNGVHSIVDFNTESPEGTVSWAHAGVFDARISGSTPGRVIGGLTGVRAEVNLASSSSSQVIPKTYGVWVQFNPSGTNIKDASHTGILIGTPTIPGSGTTIGTQNGLWIEDQQLIRSGGGGSAILVSAQTASNGSEGNVRLNGANWNNGHVQLFRGHLWRDATRGVLRYKNLSPPLSEADGNALVTGTGSNSHGVVMWGVSSSIDPKFDTGNEVCGASGVGLRCVDTSEIGPYQRLPCDEEHSASKWLAFCK